MLQEDSHNSHPLPSYDKSSTATQDKTTEQPEMLRNFSSVLRRLDVPDYEQIPSAHAPCRWYRFKLPQFSLLLFSLSTSGVVYPVQYRVSTATDVIIIISRMILASNCGQEWNYCIPLARVTLRSIARGYAYGLGSAGGILRCSWLVLFVLLECHGLSGAIKGYTEKVI